MSDKKSLLEAAMDYDSRSWRVIPLHRVGPDGKTCSCRKGANCGRSAGKHPKTEEWQNTPRMSGADIHATWGVDKPPNLGLAVGEPSGFWVLDIDPEHGGFETMKDLVAAHGRLPDTFTVRTGSGGLHYYFLLPDFELRNSSNRVGQGIDTRANGGQVVAAPSRSGVGDYTVIQDLPLAQAPDWVLELARKQESVAPVVTAVDLPKPDELTDEQWARLSAYARKAIGSELQRLDAIGAARTPNPADYRGEPWNHTTFQVACSLIEFANSPWNDYSLGGAYQDVFTRAPRDGEFDDHTVNKTFESARERIGEKARPMPEDRQQAPTTVDPLLNGPDVRQRPSGGDGPQVTPVALTGSADRFFDKKDLLVDVLDGAVRHEGPIGWGRDNRFWSYDHGVWSQDPDVVERRCVALLEGRFRNSHVDNVSTIVKHRSTPITGDPISELINFQNGMLDWKSGDMVPHEPGFRSTIQIPYEYDPTATCPTFDAFLADVLHEDYVAMAWEMIGYLLMSGNPLQVAFMFYGKGSNGKGTLIRVMEKMLGIHNIANESLDQLNNSTFSAANLYGKIANIAGDIDASYQESTATFKMITGEDMVPAEHKYGARFRFENWAVPLFSANGIPGSADVTDGYLRRWIVLHFHKTITKKILGFSDLLRTEIPGIIAKAIPALRTLIARGEFDPRGEATKGKEEFALNVDQVRQWSASGDPILSPGSWTPLRDLYASYAVWSERVGKRKVSEQEFSHRLEAIGHPLHAHQGVASHQGLTVTSFQSRHTSPANMFSEE